MEPGDAHDSFDVIVVGGGIHGVLTAWLLGRQGLAVVLLERDDWGSGATHNSNKIIHGGFRYLQHLNLNRIRISSREARRWLRLGPEWITPLEFCMPTFDHGLRRRWLLQAGGMAYDLLTLGRNAGLPESQHRRRVRTIGRGDLRRHLSSLPMAGITGGARWWDAQIRDSDALIIALLGACERQDVRCRNYTEVTALTTSGSGIAGVAAVDTRTGAEHELTARAVVLCSGPGTTALLQTASCAERQRFPGWIGGFNLVVDRPPPAMGFGVPGVEAADASVGKDKRLFFLTPWQGRMLIGTAHGTSVASRDWKPTGNDVRAFLDEVNASLPELGLRFEDVLYCYHGMTPQALGDDDLAARSHSNVIVDHGAKDGVEGLVSAIGVKYTTARYLAEATARLTCSKLGTPFRRAELGADDLRGPRGCEDYQVHHLADALLRRSNRAARGLLSAADVDAELQRLARRLGWDAQRCDTDQPLGLAPQLHALESRLVPLSPAD